MFGYSKVEEKNQNSRAHKLSESIDVFNNIGTHVSN